MKRAATWTALVILALCSTLLAGCGSSVGEAGATTGIASPPDAGVSVVAVGRSRDEAQRAADAVARSIWQERDGFVYTSAPLAARVAQARALQARADGRPVLLLDHGDNVMSGGTCDTTELLQECLRQGLANIGVGPLCDPGAVDAAVAAGLDSVVELELGNVRPLGLGTDPRPRLRVRARIRALTDGRFRITGPIYTGETWAMGRTAVLEADAFTAVVTERPMEPLDLGVFTSAGVDPTRFDFLILKSRMYCRPSFVPIAGGLVESDSRGVTSSDYGLFRFERVRRPIHPLDPDTRYP